MVWPNVRIALDSLGLEVCSDRQVFSPVVGEEPLDVGAELTVHPFGHHGDANCQRWLQVRDHLY
jgi:hypothetical protein